MTFQERVLDAAPDYLAFAAGIAVYALLVNAFYQILSKRVMFLSRREEEAQAEADQALAAAHAATEEAEAAAKVAAQATKDAVEATDVPEAKEARDAAVLARQAIMDARKETSVAVNEAAEAVTRVERVRMAKGWLGWVHLALFPLFAFLYFLLLSAALLVLAGGQQEPLTVFTLAIGIIAAVRITAYISEPTSHDVAKMLPLGLLGVVLLDTEVTGFAEALARMTAMVDHLEVIGTFLAFTIVLEFTLRTAYLTARKAKLNRWMRKRPGHGTKKQLGR